MIGYIIPLISSYLPMFDYVIWYIFALCFIVAVPSIIMAFFRK